MAGIRVRILYSLDLKSSTTTAKVKLGKTEFQIPFRMFEGDNKGENQIDWFLNREGNIFIPLSTYNQWFKNKLKSNGRYF